jgi:hypothetical protein
MRADQQNSLGGRTLLECEQSIERGAAVRIAPQSVNRFGGVRDDTFGPQCTDCREDFSLHD